MSRPRIPARPERSPLAARGAVVRQLELPAFCLTRESYFGDSLPHERVYHTHERSYPLLRRLAGCVKPGGGVRGGQERPTTPGQGRAGARIDRCAKRLHPVAHRALGMALSGVVGWRDPPRWPSGSRRHRTGRVQSAAWATAGMPASVGASTTPRRSGGVWSRSSASH